MKVSLFFPLVSLSFFTACSPAVYNTDPVRNINQEEPAVHSFPTEKKSGKPDGGSQEEISRSLSTAKTAVAVQDVRRKETGIRQAVVVYSSKLVPIVEEEVVRETGRVEQKRAPRFSSAPSDYKKGTVHNTPSRYVHSQNEKSGSFSRNERTGAGESEQAYGKNISVNAEKSISVPRVTAGVGTVRKFKKVYPFYVPVQSEQELKEELTALEKTGDWSDSGKGKQEVLSSYGIQCDLPKSFAPGKPKLDGEFLSSVEKEKVVVQPEQTSSLKKPVCDFPVTINKQVEFYLNQFQNRQRSTFRRWLQRSALYMPVIEKELKKAGMPQSLAYLAMIESGFNPAAYSPAHASGLWQFIPGTARHYGLRVDSWVDERRNFEKATQAALSYLDALYKRFGDWQLAVAAYNAGEGKIQRGLAKYKAKNFWDLAAKNYLSLETKRYVPKLIAAIIIAHDPKRYGFEPVPGKNEQYDVIEVPPRTKLSSVAAAGGCSIEEIRQLNIELLKGQVPPAKGMYSIKVPAGSSVRIALNLKKIHADEKRKVVHRLRKGETLSGVGKRYNVSVSNIMQWNDIDNVRRVRAGRKLVLYPYGKKGVKAGKTEKGMTISYYRVRNGDSLWSIAQKHQVSTREIKRWNQLNNNLLHPGKKLVIKKS